MATEEPALAEFAANRAEGMTAVGGALRVTNERLVFTPTVHEVGYGRKPWSCALTDVVAIGIEPRRLINFSSGGLRKRLRIELRDGTCELFVVSRVAERAAQLRELMLVS